MDKIWYRNPLKSEVIGLCGGVEKNEWPRRTDKSITLKKKDKQKGVHNNERVLGQVLLWIYLVYQLCGIMTLSGPQRWQQPGYEITLEQHSSDGLFKKKIFLSKHLR